MNRSSPVGRTVGGACVCLLTASILFLVFFVRVDFFFFGEGALAPDPPHQAELPSRPKFLFKGYQYKITPLASFQLNALVLSVKNYEEDSLSDFSPVDMALGWGMMSEESALRHVDIRQSDRRSYYKTSLIILDEVLSNSCNFHMVPANRSIDKIVKEARPGDVIEFDGYLVKLVNDEHCWTSSLSRTDRGDGACEVVWIENLKVIHDPVVAGGRGDMLSPSIYRRLFIQARHVGLRLLGRQGGEGLNERAHSLGQ